MTRSLFTLHPKREEDYSLQCQRVYLGINGLKMSKGNKAEYLELWTGQESLVVFSIVSLCHYVKLEFLVPF